MADIVADMVADIVAGIVAGIIVGSMYSISKYGVVIVIVLWANVDVICM